MAEAGSLVMEALECHARAIPGAPALEGERVTLGYGALAREVARVAALIEASGARVVALALDNGPAWAVADLAALAAGVALVPLPPFFTPAQTAHVLESAGVEAVIAPAGAPFEASAAPIPFEVAGERLRLFPRRAAHRPLPPGCAKITYTSGTTGEPKGVCLSGPAMERVALSLAEALEVGDHDLHLATLPLAVLLENVAGLYVPLLRGAAVTLLPLARVGMRGSSRFDPERLCRALDQQRPTSLILLPAMLQALVEALEAGAPRPRSLRLVAVGGAPVSPRLLERAEAAGLPVVEGYGLSECASVVAVNTPRDHRRGSVGRPLPHVEVALADDGEILLRGGSLFLGYLGGEVHDPGRWYGSGDLGRIDEAGFLHIEGRKKSCFITAFGRNVAPEWVERELTEQRAIAQAFVHGEARPFNVAVVVPAPGATAREVAAAIERANRRLPDYARVGAHRIADAPFSPENGQLTATGRPRREAILAAYGESLSNLYPQPVEE